MITNSLLNAAHGHLSFTLRLTVMSASGPSAMSISSEPLFSETETDSSSTRSRSGKNQKVLKRLWHSEWETAYLVSYDKKTDTCMCLKCNKKIDSIKKILYKDTVRNFIQIPRIGVLRKGKFILNSRDTSWNRCKYLWHSVSCQMLLLR